jgi:hypothetical protein
MDEKGQQFKNGENRTRTEECLEVKWLNRWIERQTDRKTDIQVLNNECNRTKNASSTFGEGRRGGFGRKEGKEGKGRKEREENDTTYLSSCPSRYTLGQWHLL